MRERDSILMVILGGLGVQPELKTPVSSLCLRTLRVRVGVFHLAVTFTSPTLNVIQHGMHVRAPLVGGDHRPGTQLEVIRY